MQDLKDLSDEQLYRQSIINKYNLHVTGVQETRAGGGDETATNPNDLFFEGKLKLRTWLVCREYTHSPPSGVSPASVFRVSLFPATLCFAVFRVSEFGRGCEGPCFVFRVSDFPRLFRACGALGLRRRLRRALTSQGRKPQRQTQTVMKSVRRLYLT